MKPAATCVITGGAGNLGCQIAGSLAERFERLVLVDLRPEAPAGLPANAVYLPLDLGRPESIEKIMEFHPEAIVHLASLLSGSSETNRRTAWQLNATATFELLEQAMSLKNCRFLFASSVATYGGKMPEVITDFHPQWPQTFYGVTKVACERLGAYARHQHGFDFRCIRLPIVISKNAPPAAVSAISSRAFIDSAKTGRFVFPVSPETRFHGLYVKDSVRAFVDLLSAPQEAIHQPVYNLSGFQASFAGLSQAIRAILPQTTHVFEPLPEIDQVLAQWPVGIDDSAARNDWGWMPGYSLEKTAEDFIGALQHDFN